MGEIAAGGESGRVVAAQDLELVGEHFVKCRNSASLVASLPARRAARTAARARGGEPARQLMETYTNDLTALAFLHDAVMTSSLPPDPKVAVQVGTLLSRLQILRPYVHPTEVSGPIPTLGLLPG